MGFRFRKSIAIGKVLRINVSKSGIGASVGVPGYRIGRGPRGKRTTISIPGTGISHVTESRKKTAKPNPAPPPKNNRSCGVLAVIGAGLLVALVLLSLIIGAISSVAERIGPKPTVGIDQAVSQLYATMTMEAAVAEVLATEQAAASQAQAPEATKTLDMRTFICEECANPDGSILPINLWETPDEMGLSGGKVLHGDRCEFIESRISIEGIDKSLVKCPGGQGWTRTEALLP